MAFQDSADSLLTRLHITSVPKVVFIALAVVLALSIALAAFSLVQGGSGEGFEVLRSEESANTAPVGQDLQDESPEESKESEGNPDVSASTSSVEENLGSATDNDMIFVHIDGAVKNPGVYQVHAGSRVVDAVEAAGGLLEDAQTATVNLAQELVDGQQVVVAKVGEEPSVSMTAQSSNSTERNGSGLVNINTASVAELTTLKGVGEATAEKIVAERESGGPFTSLDDLTRVSGIGEKKLAALRDSICL